jgi:hypothetical protein
MGEYGHVPFHGERLMTDIGAFDPPSLDVSEVRQRLQEHLESARASCGSDSVAVLSTWLDLCRDDCSITDHPEAVRRTGRVFRALSYLRLSGESRRHTPYRIDGRFRDHPRHLHRAVPLHRRGGRGAERDGRAVDHYRKQRLHNRRKVYTNHAIPLEAYPAFRHLQRVWGDAICEDEPSLDRGAASLPHRVSSEIAQWCLDLAYTFHHEVKPMSRVRAVTRPFFFGRARCFNLQDNSGKHLGRRKAGGVWVSGVGRKDADGIRSVAIVFEDAGRKRRYERVVPMRCDPGSVDLRPPRPRGRREPDYIRAYRSFLQSILPGLPLSAFVRNIGGGDFRWGRLGYEFEKGRWVRKPGLWVDSIDPQSSVVSVCTETETTCVCRHVPLEDILGDLVVSISSFVGSFWRFELKDGRVLYAFIEPGHFCFGDSFTDACQRRNDASAESELAA